MRVLVLSRNYPNPVMPLLGLWVERPTVAVNRDVRTVVVSPVPWCPPLPSIGPVSELTRFRQVPTSDARSGIKVRHPRFAVGLGSRFHNLEARAYMLGVRGTVRDLYRDFPFDLIHAHFSYPDGVVATQLGQQYGVPVVV